MILALLFVITLAALVVAVYLLGFRLGGDRWVEELQRVRQQAARAERQIHDLTRQAFAAMAEEVERRRHQG